MLQNILVVDDSKLQAKHAVDLCRRLAPGADIRSCDDGSQALSSLRERSADVVVLDLEMPVMDGVLLAAHIAEESLAAGIVICSSKDPMLIASVGAMSETNGLAVLGTLQKPIKYESLQQSFNKFEVTQSCDLTSNNSKTDFPEISLVELKAAINNEEIELYYQSKLTTKGMLLKGVEALARWNHPVHGFIPPPVFISMAEEHDVIDSLTISLLKRAIDDIQKFERCGLRLNVSVNLSPKSIGKPCFGAELIQAVSNAHIAPERIIFEVTENLLMSDIVSSLKFLARLRLSNFGISIDDFGTGFANAEQLSRLPATELKIDRSLVHNASKKWQQRQILESTIRLAQNLNLSTVAEGVENLEDYQLLSQLGIDLIQGYIFAKPMCRDDLLAWVTGSLSELRKRILSST